MVMKSMSFPLHIHWTANIAFKYCMMQVTVFDVFYGTRKYRAFTAGWVRVVSAVEKCLESITSR
jgi:hypothetical protein